MLCQARVHVCALFKLGVIFGFSAGHRTTLQLSIFPAALYSAIVTALSRNQTPQ